MTNIGTIEIQDLFVGSVNAVGLYFGSVKVWEKSEPPSNPWLCFTAEEANSTVALSAVGSAPSVSLECSTDGSTWSPFVVGTTTVTLANIGDKVYFRAGNDNAKLANNLDSNCHNFVLTGKLAVSGNIMTLLKGDGSQTELVASTNDNAFACLFDSCTALYDASGLILPSSTATSGCYANMFYGCSSLTTAPSLPATTLASYCYCYMFGGCTSLTTAPALPATTLAFGCYANMFYGCTSLTSAPELPATTLTNYCYEGMFQGCSSLNSITLGYTGNFSTTYFNTWVSGVAASGIFYYNGSDTTTGASAIPRGWTVVSNSTKVKYTAASGYSDWSGDISGALKGSISYRNSKWTVRATTQITNVSSAKTITVGTSVTSIESGAFASSSLSAIVVPSTTDVIVDAFYNSSVSDVTMIGRTMADVQNMSGWPLQTKIYGGGAALELEKFSLPTGCVIHCTDGDITVT